MFFVAVIAVTSTVTVPAAAVINYSAAVNRIRYSRSTLVLLLLLLHLLIFAADFSCM